MSRTKNYYKKSDELLVQALARGFGDAGDASHSRFSNAPCAADSTTCSFSARVHAAKAPR